MIHYFDGFGNQKDAYVQGLEQKVGQLEQKIEQLEQENEQLKKLKVKKNANKINTS